MIIVTPEHVPIELLPAGLGRRFWALLVDWALQMALYLALATPLNLLLPGGLGAPLLITLGFVIMNGYHIYYELRHEGRSPGKRLLGLRVVDERGLPLTFQQALLRSVVRLLDFAPFGYGLGALTALLDPHGRRLGDLVAGTLVIRERPPRTLGPRWNAAVRRHNSLRTSAVRRRLRAVLGLEDREFLLDLCQRAGELEPAARYDLMEQAAGHYRERLGIDDPHLSGENLVRDLTALLYANEG